MTPTGLIVRLMLIFHNMKRSLAGTGGTDNTQASLAAAAAAQSNGFLGCIPFLPAFPNAPIPALAVPVGQGGVWLSLSVSAFDRFPPRAMHRPPNTRFVHLCCVR